MTRPLVTRYEDDLRLFPDAWHKLGLALGILLVLAYPFWVGSSWLTVGNQTLVAIVGAVGLMILTGFAGQISLGHAAFLASGDWRDVCLRQIEFVVGRLAVLADGAAWDRAVATIEARGEG